MTIHTGGCYCGKVRYKVDDAKVLLSAYCHCTNCQRLTSGSSVHSIHLPRGSTFLLSVSERHAKETGVTIKGEVDTFSFVSKSEKHRQRCKVCGTQFASYNSTKDTWSVWSSTMDKVDGKIPEALKPTAHMFYGTRQFDVDDGLGKWEGYEDKSNRIA